MIRVIIEELNIATKNDFNLNEICFLTRMKFESQKSRNINIVDLLIELPLLLEQQLPNIHGILFPNPYAFQSVLL